MFQKHTRWLARMLFVVVGATAWGCSATPTVPQEVLLSPAPPSQERPQFEVRGPGVHGISSFLFWSESKAEPLWAFTIRPTDVSPRDLPSLTYGVLPSVPDPALCRVKQVFPREGEPRSLLTGERLFVQVEYQYDKGFVPYGGRTYFSFEVQQDHSLKALGKFDWATEPEAVQELYRRMSGPEE